MKNYVWIAIMLLTAVGVNAQKEKEETFLQKIRHANVFFVDKQELVSKMEWNAHPKFKGVYLKHLITGKDTKGQISYHLVKIDPECVLEEHVHVGTCELHQIVSGSGVCLLDKQKINYLEGVSALIPADTKHQVKAGKEGLFLIATFSPALQ